MSGTVTSLTYDQSGYPYARAAAFLRKRAIPKRYQIACSAAMIVMLGPLLFANLPPPGRVLSLQSLPFACFCLGWLALRLLNARFIRTYYQDIANSPYRSGPRQMDLTEAGITVTSPHSRWSYPWSQITEVIAGPEGTAMILLGSYEYEPIAAKAFSSDTARDGFIALAHDLLTAAKEKVS